MLVGVLTRGARLTGVLSSGGRSGPDSYVPIDVEDIVVDDVVISDMIGELLQAPPISFQSAGAALLDYVIYGADGGVGDPVDSGYLIPVKIVGKNLFDKDNAEIIFAYPDQSSGQVTDGASFNAHSLVIPVTQGDYTFSIYHPTNQLIRNRNRIVCYSSYPTVGTNAISSIYESGAVRDGDYMYLSFTAPEETAYILVFLWSGSAYTSETINQIITNNKLQLEYGNVRTEYQPYSGNTVNINLDHPLYFDDVLTMADSDVTIPINIGANTLTVETTVQPESVYIKYNDLRG